MLAKILFGVSAAYLRGEPGQVALPFPDVKEAEEALVSQPEAPAPEAEAAPVVEQQEAPPTVSAWHMPTLTPDPVLAGADAFKHPTQEMIKDWETAPKIDMFDAPTEKPIEDPMKVQADPMAEVDEPTKKVEAALPAVQSKLHPVNPYGKLDDNAELAAIQRESPDAYGIVKALMMKKQMGLPLPGAEAAANAQSAREQMAGERQQNPDATSGHINNMWNWKPQNSASDEIAVTQEMSDTVEAPAPTDAPAPAAFEAPAEAPAPELPAEPAVTEAAAPAEAAPAAPAPAAEAPASGMMAMSSWLGATVKAPAPVEREVQVPKQGADLMSKYALDLA